MAGSWPLMPPAFAKAASFRRNHLSLCLYRPCRPHRADDLTDLALTCRFSDCQHEVEPGCAVQAAIAAGDLDPDRLQRWYKLKREDRFNSQTIHQAHLRARTFGKMHRKVGDKRNPDRRR